MITPQPGYMINPDNPNGVVKIGSINPNTGLEYTQPVSAAAVAPVTSSPSVISSAKGADIVASQTQKLNQLSSNPANVPNTTGGTNTPKTDAAKTGTATDTGAGGTSTAAKPIQTTVTLINPETEQTVTFQDASINKDNIQRYLASGYHLSEANGAIPDWMQPNGVQDSATQTPTQKMQAEVDQAGKDLKSLTDNLTKFTISDADLQQQIQGITAQWDARIADMQRVNASRTGAINTLGIRLGSRFAGGSGGQFGGIVSEEERQGVQRIADLEGQKQAAIAAAKAAALSQNWSVYSKQVDLAEKAYSDKVTALKDLQTATAAQNKAIQDAIHQQNTDYYNQVEKPINDVLQTVVKNNAPKEVQDAIRAQLSSDNPSIADAITAAGNYLQDVPTTGIVGEYLFYKKQAELAGQTAVDFNTYQNMDANRKRPVTNVYNASGLNNQTLTKVEGIANQFDGEQIVKDYNTVSTQVAFIKTLGSAPTDDMARVYAFAKVMDPNSVVRESEYKTVQDYSQAVLQAAGLKAKRVFTSSGFLTDEARNFINTTLDQRLKTQQGTYDNVRNEYGRRINKITGAQDGTEYITDYSKGYDTTTSLLKTEDQAHSAVTDFGAAHPEARDQILKLAGVPQASLGGRAYTWAEIAQILGIQ